MLIGRASAVEARDNIVFSESGEVVLFGAEGLVVVRTGDKTLVMPRALAPDLKALLTELESAD